MNVSASKNARWSFFLMALIGSRNLVGKGLQLTAKSARGASTQKTKSMNLFKEAGLNALNNIRERIFVCFSLFNNRLPNIFYVFK